MNQKERRKYQIVEEYAHFFEAKHKEGNAFYYNSVYELQCHNLLYEFRELRNVFVNDIKETKLFYYTYADCVLTYIEIYLRKYKFISENNIYYLPNDYQNHMPLLFKLIDEGLEIIDKYEENPYDLKLPIDEHARIKRLLIQKIICVLGYCYDEYEEKFLQYALIGIRLHSIQTFGALIEYYCSNNHLNLKKAKSLLEECLEIPINGTTAANKFSQVVGKLNSFSILFHGLINNGEYKDALSVAHQCRDYLSSEETSILTDNLKKEMLDITSAFIMQSSKKMIEKPKYSYDVFISYSSSNNEIAGLVEAGLRKNNIEKIWRDKKAIEGGDSFLEEIINGIDNSNVFLIVLTPESEDSQWVRRELTYAISNNKTIIPYKIGKYESNAIIKFALNVVQIVDSEKTNIDELAMLIKEKINAN